MNPLSQGWTRSVRSVRTPLLAPYSVHRFALWSFLLGLGTRWGQRGLTSAGGVRQGPGTCRHGRLYFSHRFPSDQAPAPALPRPSGVVGEGSVPQRDALSQGRPEEHSTRRSHGGSLARRLHLQEPLPGAWENQNQSLSGHNTAPSDLAGDSSWAPPAQDPDPYVPAEGTWGPCVVWQTEAGDHGRLHRCQEVQWAHPAPAAVPQALLWARPACQRVCVVVDSVGTLRSPSCADRSERWDLELAGVWPTWETLLENVLLLPARGLWETLSDPLCPQRRLIKSPASPGPLLRGPGHSSLQCPVASLLLGGDEDHRAVTCAGLRFEAWAGTIWPGPQMTTPHPCGPGSSFPSPGKLGPVITGPRTVCMYVCVCPRVCAHVGKRWGRLGVSCRDLSLF